eukprot:2137693-Alexandrium_andersonii.AAC.1
MFKRSRAATARVKPRRKLNPHRGDAERSYRPPRPAHPTRGQRRRKLNLFCEDAQAGRTRATRSATR